ncbi:hypothetical protein J1614_001588 [Plenodomus biglobosus]|nr:hypothetical protein J1614_001588 [Plenodomus biglobosus]
MSSHPTTPHPTPPSPALPVPCKPPKSQKSQHIALKDPISYNDTKSSRHVRPVTRVRFSITIAMISCCIHTTCPTLSANEIASCGMDVEKVAIPHLISRCTHFQSLKRIAIRTFLSGRRGKPQCGER